MLLELVLLEFFTALFALINVLLAPLLMRLNITLLNAHAAAKRADDVTVVDKLLQAPVRLDTHWKYFFATGALLARELVEAVFADNVAAL